MNVEGLKMPPFNTTLMGVVRGVADHFRLDLSDAMLYGGSGHAFLMNIHEQLCPSGPYCWKYDRFFALLRNLGIEMTDLGFFSALGSPTERDAIEQRIRGLLEQGVLCSLLNLEHQLITGWDQTGFLTAQPWAPRMDFPPGHLAFGTWAEMGQEVHVTFFSFRKIGPAIDQKVIADSLGYAVDLHRRPSCYTDKPYAVGAEAYQAWIAAVEQGHGASHGNWWNGVVWAECRRRASEYFLQIAASHPRVAPSAHALAADFSAIAAALLKVSDRGLDPGGKVALLRDAGDRETSSLSAVEALAEALA